jgi:hypothetical protein
VEILANGVVDLALSGAKIGSWRGHRSPRARDRHEESEPEESAHEEP